MMDLLTIISSVGLSTICSGVVAWLFRNWISERLKNSIRHEYDLKLEVHKAQLKSESDVAIERLRSQLQIAATEQQVRFSKIFERTAETIAETYSKLLAVYQALTNYTAVFEMSNMGTKAERRTVLNEKMREMSQYFYPRKLFLPESTAKRIDNLFTELRKVGIDFLIHVEQQASEGRVADIKQWQKASDYCSSEVPTTLEMLERDFRKLLGIQDNEASPVKT